MTYSKWFEKQGILIRALLGFLFLFTVVCNLILIYKGVILLGDDDDCKFKKIPYYLLLAPICHLVAFIIRFMQIIWEDPLRYFLCFLSFGEFILKNDY